MAGDLRQISRAVQGVHVNQVLARRAADIPDPFGEPTKFEVLHNGRRYSPKAVIGLVCRYLTGSVLPPDQFSGAEAPGQANYVRGDHTHGPADGWATGQP